jgi:hypothetical protein
MRFYFAGAEATFNRLYEMGVRDFLLSYYYLLDKGTKSIAKRFGLADKEPVRIMIDSGGFTFNTEPDKHTLEELYEYRDKYCAWLLHNKQWITSAVELDVSVMIGQERLKKWRTKYFKPLEAAGIPIIYVWHEEDGLTGWHEMCHLHSYVGLTAMANWKETKLARYLREAKKNKTRVHGFAFTQTDLLMKLDFYTVDSTTWLSGMKYGCTYVFDGRKLKTYDSNHKHLRNKHRAHFVKHGINWDLVKLDLSEDRDKRRLAYPEINKINILGWLEFAEYVRNHWRVKKKLRKQKLEEKSQALVPVEPPSELVVAPVTKPIISLLDREDVPKLKCSSCHIAEDCPKFDEARTECAYGIAEINLDNPLEILDLKKMLLKTDFQRLQRNIQFEQLSGGYIDPSVQRLSDSTFEKAERLGNEMKGYGLPEMPSDAQTESAGGILARVMQPLIDGAKALNTIEAHFTESKGELDPEDIDMKDVTHAKIIE